MLHVAMLIGGLALLYYGAEWLVRGAAGLAERMGVPPLVVGLTVVAYGTSSPELIVSALAALAGRSEIALGNVVGSNIANLGLILGLTALASPFAVAPILVRRDLLVMLVTTAALPVLLLDGRVGRLEGAALLGGAVAFTVLVLRSSGPGAELPHAGPTPSRARLVVLTLVGLALLVGGGKLLVDGAVGLARVLGMSERVIGLTVVAVGTSVPEMATSIVAALRGHPAIAAGNVVGSNVFNILFVLGGASAIQPVQGSLPAMATDLAALGIVSVLATTLLRSGHRLSRLEGAILVAGYAAFLALLIV